MYLVGIWRLLQILWLPKHFCPLFRAHDTPGEGRRMVSLFAGAIFHVMVSSFPFSHLATSGGKSLCNRINLLIPYYSLSTFVLFESAPSVSCCSSSFLLVLLFFFLQECMIFSIIVEDMLRYCAFIYWFSSRIFLSLLIKVCMIWALQLIVSVIALLY